MMVMRECVKRHSRLPKTIVVDNGKDFISVYFDTLLARYRCIKKVRPGAKPRFGSVCERLFGTTNTQFIHNLSGNTKIMKNVRQVTKSVNPKGHAEWTLGILYEALLIYAHEVYDLIEHPALGQSPRAAFERGLIISGSRLTTRIPYNRELIINTLPSTRTGTAKVIPERGIKVNYITYWTEEFRNHDILGKQVAVRYDPFDMAIAYAYVEKKWEECRADNYCAFSGRSQKELKIIASELRENNRLHSKALYITAKLLADNLQSANQSLKISRQRACDSEQRDVFQVIEGSKNQEIQRLINLELPLVNNLDVVDINSLEGYEEF